MICANTHLDIDFGEENDGDTDWEYFDEAGIDIVLTQVGECPTLGDCPDDDWEDDC